MVEMNDVLGRMGYIYDGPMENEDAHASSFLIITFSLF